MTLGVAAARSRHGGGRRGAAALASLAAAFLACAQPSPPPGGDPDRTPPALIGIEPSPGQVLEGWDAEVVFRFDERLSERGIERAVMVSPAGLEIEIDKDGSEIRVRPEGGWPQDRIIHVALLPDVRDLFGNQRTDPVRLVFSTGPPIPATALGGTAVDRLTGQPVPGARVEATFGPHDATYVALTDSAGIFALADLPAGSYDVAAYLDRNRNAVIDFGEMLDTARLGLQPTDTTVLELALLPGDTTAAHVVSAEALDSLHVVVTLDDFLDPAATLEGIRAALYALPDSTPVPVAEVLHRHELTARQAAADSAAAAAAAAAADTAAGAAAESAVVEAPDTIRVEAPVQDTLAPPVQTPARLPARAGAAVPGETAAGAAPAEPLPSRELVIVAGRTLEAGAAYQVVLLGIRNIRGLAGGGGSAAFEVPEPPPSPETPPDSMAAPMDSAAVPIELPASPASDSTSAPASDSTAARRAADPGLSGAAERWPRAASTGPKPG